MKKVITVVLAVVMLASMACVTTGAAILFTDPFDTWTDYWVEGDANQIVSVNGNNVLEGWSEARVHQAKYEDDDVNGGYKSTLSALTTGTFWVDLYAEVENDENAGAGLWWKNTYYEKHNGAEEADTYRLTYFPSTSTVKFTRSFPAATTDEEKLIATYEDPRQLGANISSMTPVTLGMRVEVGQISAFVNGKCIATFVDSTIGTDACPVLFWNDGLHAYWDNYNLGDLAELPLKDAPKPIVNPTPAPAPTDANNPGPANNETPTQIVTQVADVTDASGNAVTDESGNKVTQVVSEVVTVPAADTNKGGAQGVGGAQTGDMTVVVVAVMIISLGAAIVVKKVYSAR